jgi:hypothetical protein
VRQAGPAGVDGTHQYATAALSVFWPEEEFRILVARWPHVAAHIGGTWDEHRRRVERHCALNTYPDLRTVTIPMTAWPPANGALLVRLGTQVQAVLPPARARHPGLRHPG